MTADPHANRISPLAGFAGVSDARLDVREIPFLRQTNVRADPARLLPAWADRLPLAPGTWRRSGETDILYLGPDEWLAIGDLTPVPAEPRADTARRVGQDDVILTDVSAQRTIARVAGPGARDLLAHGCALDLHPSVFGPGRCAQTMLARAQVILMARERDEFWILVRASFARYLAAWIADAAVDY
ncbi:sarcosine oxidase subunit gamma [Sphaerisporangium album]|uniref:Sarcosine oxidase subunit gamma n=1 Tax=Sphaerisporangium album TaxID=509200 RepID=A0A367EH60_9ACTN|nr:sarcosine oxidase subunit gamma family protein [Sphaerisporangium album]RCG17404.1 sarcosine oxidase subunit gamma [Sphaerisporangium album]